MKLNASPVCSLLYVRRLKNCCAIFILSQRSWIIAATSHYLSQWWPHILTHISVNRNPVLLLNGKRWDEFLPWLKKRVTIEYMICAWTNDSFCYNRPLIWIILQCFDDKQLLWIIGCLRVVLVDFPWFVVFFIWLIGILNSIKLLNVTEQNNVQSLPEIRISISNFHLIVYSSKP